MQLDLDARVLRPPTERDGPDDQIHSDVNVLVDPQPHLFEHFHLVGDEVDDALGASPLTLGERLAISLKHDSGIKDLFAQVPKWTRVAGFVRLVDGLHNPRSQLHRLLRHRLLLEAEIGEGAGAVKVDDQAGDLVVVDVKQRRSLRPHLSQVERARLTPPAIVGENEHALGIQIAVFLCFGAVVSPCVEPAPPADSHPG